MIARFPNRLKPMRGILILIVVVAIATAVAKLSPKPAPAAPAPAGPAFSEARVKFASPSREIEMVLVGEKPTAAECDAHSRTYRLPAICTSGALTCQITKVECSDAIGDRYRNMLAQQPSVTHYAHFRRKAGETERSFALVAWGLTAEESQQVCESMRQADLAKGAEGEKLTCI
jgi:hypothetical protein